MSNDALQVEQGRLAVGTIYLGGGVCGALGASLLHRKFYLMGASAGVYALLTSHLAHLYLVCIDFFYSKKLRNILKWKFEITWLLANFYKKYICCPKVHSQEFVHDCPLIYSFVQVFIKEYLLCLRSFIHKREKKFFRYFRKNAEEFQEDIEYLKKLWKIKKS